MPDSDADSAVSQDLRRFLIMTKTGAFSKMLRFFCESVDAGAQIKRYPAPYERPSVEEEATIRRSFRSVSAGKTASALPPPRDGVVPLPFL